MVGQNIGKYRVLDRVGRGGMGTVYRAVDETLHREVAIKVLNTELNDPGVARRFRSEAVTVARLNHPGIAMVYELFENEGQWLMVMEFVRGETIESLASRKGTLPVEQAADICMQALGALAHAHGLGVVHRDLKPANLMIGESGTVKITDFGIARVVGTEHLTSAGFMIGTPAYMAPEQVLGQEIDARADLYSMGVVLYHLATGKLPFKGDTPMQLAQSRLHDQPTPIRSVRQELPAWLGQLLDIALSRAPERRFQTAALFREALRRGLANLPFETPGSDVIPPELIATAAPNSMPVATLPSRAVTAVPVPAMPTVISSTGDATTAGAPLPRSSRTLPIAIAAAAALVVVALAWMWMRPSQAPAPSPEAEVVTVAPPAPSLESVTPSLDSPAATTTPAAPPIPPAIPLPSVDDGAQPSAPVAVPGAGTPAPVEPASGRGVTAVAGGGTATGPGSGAPAAARARGRAAAPPTPADPAVAFNDLRTLVVKGKDSQEQLAVLHLFAGQLSLVLQNGVTLASMPYRELTRAMYTRGRSPKWDAALAGPPADLNVPGGLFRSARHWLSLQSRNTYVILRLNDADWRQVIDTITTRTGVKVEQSASGG